MKALIAGTLEGCFGSAAERVRWRRLLCEAAPDGVPVADGLPFGHTVRNLAFPVGATVAVDTGAGEIRWLG